MAKKNRGDKSPEKMKTNNGTKKKRFSSKDESSISWTNYTYNPWQNCRRISKGCRFCYMFREKSRYGQDTSKVIKSAPATFNKPLKWGKPSLVFTCSWSDFFIEEANEWRDEAWAMIKETPHLTYQILTKRPERILEHLPSDWREGYDNVWLGVSIENNDSKSRLHELVIVPSKVKFISAEPLLERIEFTPEEMNILKNHYHWLIIGGESGNDNGKHLYRPCELEWLQYLVDVGTKSHMPVFVKQLGTYLSKTLGLRDRHARVISEFPKNLKIQEFPQSTPIEILDRMG